MDAPVRKHLVFSIYPELQLVLEPGDEEWVTDGGGRAKKVTRVKHRAVVFYRHLAEIDETDVEHVKRTCPGYGTQTCLVSEMEKMRKDIKNGRATFYGMARQVHNPGAPEITRMRRPIEDWELFWEAALDRQKELDRNYEMALEKATAPALAGAKK